MSQLGVAGQRVGKGEPFLNLDHPRPADTIVVETKSTWFIYTVRATTTGDLTDGTDGIPGRES